MRTDMIINVQMSSEARGLQGKLKFGSNAYLHLVNRRPLYIMYFLEQGIDVLFSDVDVVLLQNPFAHFKRGFDVHAQVDQWFSNGTNRPDTLCAGFVFYRATDATRAMLNRWISIAKNRPDLPDQFLLNRLVREKRVRVEKLPRDMFVNGNDYFNETWRKQAGLENLVMVHNNWIEGHDAKLQRFKTHDLWFI